MTAPGLSIVTCCKGRLEHLKRALPTFVAQAESEVIVVDYDCPDRTGDWVAAHFPAVRVAKVAEAPIFNISRARNVGAGLARAPWLAFCDADNLLAPSFASEILARIVPGMYLRTLPEHAVRSEEAMDSPGMRGGDILGRRRLRRRVSWLGSRGSGDGRPTRPERD